MMKWVAFLIGLYLWVSPAQAVTFWEEDFENHLYPNWVGSGDCITSGSPDGVACGYPRITTAQAYAGTHSLLTHYQTAGVQAGGYMDRSVTSTRVLWTRQYAKWQNFTFGPENAKLFFACGDAGSACVVWLHQNAGNQLHALVNHTTNVTCPNGSTDITCNYDPNMASIGLNDNQWHCVETFQNFGTSGVANGALSIYIDGTQTLGYTNLLMDTNNQPITFVRPYAQYGLGDRYQDNFAVGNTRIGCSGAPPDTTPPSAPTGLYISKGE